jgi:hypothetical protein
VLPHICTGEEEMEREREREREQTVTTEGMHPEKEEMKHGKRKGIL